MQKQNLDANTVVDRIVSPQTLKSVISLYLESDIDLPLTDDILTSFTQTVVPYDANIFGS